MEAKSQVSSLAQFINENLSDLTGPDDAPLVVLAPSDSSCSRQEQIESLETAVKTWAERPDQRLILVSSAAVYGPDYRSTEFVTEEVERGSWIKNAESDWWAEVEATVLKAAADRADEVLILRPPTFIGGASDRFSHGLSRARFAFPTAGFDPCVQVVSAASVANCVRAAFEKQLTGIYNIASEDVVPLSVILKFLGTWALRFPRTFQQLLRPILFRWIDGMKSIAQLNFTRYPNTASGKKFAGATGLTISTRDELQKLRRERHPDATEEKNLPEFDPFGYVDSFRKSRGRTIHSFFEKIYWRIERKGFEHIPKSGPAIIAGPHRGFMPLDAVMHLHLITKYARRLPRFLIHPTLVKFPVQSRFFRRLGGLLACQKNGDWVLENDGLLGVFPEGIRGAFKMYKDVYDLGKFGRPDYIKWSLKYRAPIVPFVVLGTAEIFPIFGKIKWNWFRRYMEWPFLPITPTFPFLPVPLPSKWHVQFLPAIDPTEAEAEALETGENPEILIARRVRESIEAATKEMLAKRKSIFRGSVFGDEKDGPAAIESEGEIS
ncbi:MAG: 1-acyl-sn-glycerol-3-phosphate acyltransferase [Verrucomicrobiales bacterium]|jgi:1-acyl-sn-glycerol-3-phosphate acyltransferase